MTPGLIEGAMGAYKSEWDNPSAANLPTPPDYEEIMIWDKKPGARSGDNGDLNPEDGQIGDFNHPDFFENVGDTMTGVRGHSVEDSIPTRPIGTYDIK